MPDAEEETSSAFPGEEGPALYIAEALPRLLQLLQQSDVRELDLHEGEVRIHLHRVAVPQAAAPGEAIGETDVLSAAEPGLASITSPLVGTFYRAEKPGAPPLVEEGSHVEPDTVVGIVEALQQLTDVEAGTSGTIANVLATDGQPVEYGQALFEVLLNA